MRELSSNSEHSDNKKIWLAVIVAALGYFVDVYDLLLFSSVRIQSLQSIGLTGEDLLSKGILLLNLQMIGMLLGGIFFGIWGDKYGRVKVLFGSIFLYSLANLANGFVTSVEQYAILRFIAGFGLAGEIGAGITLVSELMPKEKRGYGTTIVATIGVSGAIVASLVAKHLDWRTAYIIGGLMGLGLLVLRISVCESGLFNSVKNYSDIRRGDLRILFKNNKAVFKYISCILIGTPIWFIVGILVTFSPEIGKSLNIQDTIVASSSVFYSYVGFTLGDLASGLISQLLKSRKKTIFFFILSGFLCTYYLLTSSKVTSAPAFYNMIFFLGFFGGYWAVFITTSAEQFGTNIRATVATTSPNFVRGLTVPMTISFNYLNSTLGATYSALYVGIFVFFLSFLALFNLKETFHVDLDYID